MARALSHAQAVEAVAEGPVGRMQDPAWQDVRWLLERTFSQSGQGGESGQGGQSDPDPVWPPCGIRFTADGDVYGLWVKEVYETYLRLRGVSAEAVPVSYVRREALDVLRARLGFESPLQALIEAISAQPELDKLATKGEYGGEFHPAVRALNGALLALLDNDQTAALAAGGLPDEAMLAHVRARFDFADFAARLRRLFRQGKRGDS